MDSATNRIALQRIKSIGKIKVSNIRLSDIVRATGVVLPNSRHFGVTDQRLIGKPVKLFLDFATEASSLIKLSESTRYESYISLEI